MTIHLLIVCGFGMAMTEPSSCDQEVLAQKAENVYYLAVGSKCAHLLIYSNDSNAPTAMALPECKALCGIVYALPS